MNNTVELQLPLIPDAVAEATGFGHAYLGPEHLLLAVVKNREGATGVFCDSHGIDVPGLRADLLDILGPVPKRTSAPPWLAQRSVVALSKAIETGRARAHMSAPYATDDLFLSLLADEVAEGGVVGTLLQRRGLTPRVAHAELLRLRKGTPA